MRYGFIIPSAPDASTFAALGREAEEAGWDGVFYWDGDWGFSPWVVLSAIAIRTERVRIGAILSPLAWRRPWLFAREAASLDQLSGGRLIVPLGLGAVSEVEWEMGRTRFGEPVDRRLRASLLDEGLEVVNALWGDGPVTYHGERYRLEGFELTPKPVQSPRVPIWVVGAWPSRKSMSRALRCDGLLPTKLDGELTPDDLREIAGFVRERREISTPFDLVCEGQTPGDDPHRAAEIVRPWAEAGATWWTEAMWDAMDDVPAVRERIRQGPPRLA